MPQFRKPSLQKIKKLGTKKKVAIAAMGVGIAAAGVGLALKGKLIEKPPQTKQAIEFVAKEHESDVKQSKEEFIVQEHERDAKQSKELHGRRTAERSKRFERAAIFLPPEKLSLQQVKERVPLYEHLLTETSPPVPGKYPSAERKAILQWIASEMAVAAGFSPEEILAHIYMESSFRENVTGRSNDRGLFQLTPIAEKEILSKKLRMFFPERKWDVFDPLCNLDAGISFMHYLMKRAEAHGVKGRENQLQRARAYFRIGTTNFLSKASPRNLGKAYAQRVLALEQQFKDCLPNKLFIEVTQKVPKAFQIK